MALYYEGYSEAISNVRAAEMPDLLRHLDGLYGRDNVKDINDIEEVRREALRQMKEDFTDKDSEEYKTVSFWQKVINAK